MSPTIDECKKYIFAENEDVENDTWDDLIEKCAKIVSKTWTKSKFNENNWPLEKVISEGVCSDWLVFTDNESKYELLALIAEKDLI